MSAKRTYSPFLPPRTAYTHTYPILIHQPSANSTPNSSSPTGFSVHPQSLHQGVNQKLTSQRPSSTLLQTSPRSLGTRTPTQSPQILNFPNGSSNLSSLPNLISLSNGEERPVCWRSTRRGLMRDSGFKKGRVSLSRYVWFSLGHACFTSVCSVLSAYRLGAGVSS